MIQGGDVFTGFQHLLHVYSLAPRLALEQRLHHALLERAVRMRGDRRVGGFVTYALRRVVGRHASQSHRVLLR